MALQKIGLNKAEELALLGVDPRFDTHPLSEADNKFRQVVFKSDLIDKVPKKAGRFLSSNVVHMNAHLSSIMKDVSGLVGSAIKEELPYLEVDAAGSTSVAGPTAKGNVLEIYVPPSTSIALLCLGIPSRIPVSESPLSVECLSALTEEARSLMGYVRFLNKVSRVENLPISWTLSPTHRAATPDGDNGCVLWTVSAVLGFPLNVQPLPKVANIEVPRSPTISEWVNDNLRYHPSTLGVTPSSVISPRPGYHKIEISSDREAIKAALESILSDSSLAELLLYLDEFYRIVKTLTRVILHGNPDPFLIIQQPS